MTTQERLRAAATYLRTQHPRACHNGLYIDELMAQAADEMGGHYQLIADLMYGRVSINDLETENGA